MRSPPTQMDAPSTCASCPSTPRWSYSADRSRGDSTSALTSDVATREHLPELERVHWRRRANDRSLKRAARLWTLTTGAHAVPFLAVAVVLPALNPIMLPFALLAVAHAWAIPELYAARGANVLRRRTRESTRAEQVALGLLGDLLDHLQRELHSRHRFVLERGALGVWVLGEAGALLVRPGARTVHCYCVKVPAEELPPSDR